MDFSGPEEPASPPRTVTSSQTTQRTGSGDVGGGGSGTESASTRHHSRHHPTGRRRLCGGGSTRKRLNAPRYLDWLDKQTISEPRLAGAGMSMKLGFSISHAEFQCLRGKLSIPPRLKRLGGMWKNPHLHMSRNKLCRRAGGLGRRASSQRRPSSAGR